ncbi:TcpE family conjugal transfer membrane protein [Sphaerimonospora thailandensis]|uniref:MinD-like ATPase involved in chromosome partitioning or flagellar assembly n=1 Tax=Sphaerimonospora thailandensis TaxID=795644 RepID=A0A8J3VYU2_9ACTN|nr:TcpE family conjugal transfer membrane protein [Sphaerimonospora thailandensis]GIH69241.1 hypothetical protein Mth01_14940 [Sphaerimonospora thailandensis]
MDLPTYTNIWRIEKRLYKLYDLRLPMPLPIVWIGVFVGVLVPWCVLLALFGLPFRAPWHVVYLVPPGVLTWLSTRPVIEGKRLTELLQSQLRYLAEPRTWCRMAPMGEPEEITFTARVWRVTSPQAVPAIAETTAKAPARGPARVAVRAAGKTSGKAKAAAMGAGPVGKGPRVTGLPTAEPPALAHSARPVAKGTGRPARGGFRGVDHSAGTGSSAGTGASATAVPSADEVPSGIVRPAVAAAAAAAAPIADVPSSVSWRTASASGRGVASGGERAFSTTEAGTTSTAREAAEPVAPPSAGAQTLGAQVSDAQVSEVSTSDVAATAPVSDVPVSDVPPIGTEALRRLRRLAASAENRAVRQTDPAPRQDGPAWQEEAAEHVAAEAPPVESRRMESGPMESGPMESGLAESHAAESRGPGVTVEEVADLGKPAVSDELGDVEHPAEARRTGDPEPTSGEEVGTRAARRRDSDDWQRRAREQHRKGRPPKPMRPEQPKRETGPTQPPVQPVHPAPSAPPIQPVQPVQPVHPAPSAPPAQPGQAAHPSRVRPEVPGTAIRPPKLQPPKVRGEEPPKLRRVEAVVGRDPAGGWRRLAQVVVGGSRTDGMEIDEARARTPLADSKRIMVLGCTGGAGQTTTALMLGHSLARYREERVLALDASGGDDTMTRRIAAAPAERLGSLLDGAGSLTRYLGLGARTSRCGSGLEVLGADIDDQAAQRLADRASLGDWSRTLAVLDRHYGLTVIDPAAALAARLLPYADQLVLVAPASADAPEAIAMTYEWLDGHDCSDLRRRGVMVINGVSRRSLPEVEQAEAVASGRCRAIVRVPWEDELAPGRPGPVDLNNLRAGGRRAYVALAGVIVSSLAANRPSDAHRVRERAGEKAGE